MLKDIADSKRIKTAQQASMATETGERPDLNVFVLSRLFWPNFRDEGLKLPAAIQQLMDTYTEGYKALKAARTVEFKPCVGLVELSLEINGEEVRLAALAGQGQDRSVSLMRASLFCVSPRHQVPMKVSPMAASIIIKFQEQETWTLTELGDALDVRGLLGAEN